jgi:DNA-binding PadR family transcriptional regulator
MKSETDILKKLENLGLSPKEAKVYVSLLSFGDMVGSGKVITATGLHGQFVYDALASLEEVGLLRVATIRGRKKFAANSPTGLSSLLERKKVVADEVAEELLKLSGKDHLQDFQVFQGREAFVANEFAALKQANEGETWRIIGGSGDIFMDLMGSDMSVYDEERQKKNITILYLSTEEQRETLPNQVAHRSDFIVRSIKGYTKNNTNTLIRPNSVSINSFSEPVLAYYLYSQSTAEGYQNFFDALWELAV